MDDVALVMTINRENDLVRPYNCNFSGCTKNYFRADHLRRHLLTHTGERPFKCSFPRCTLAFFSSSHLRRHEKLHEKEKPYVCDVSGCNEAFVKKSQLWRHHCVHTGELPYFCSEPNCSKRFLYPSQLKAHIDSFHYGTRKYVCNFPLCGQSFCRQRELRKHFVEEHPDSNLVTCEKCGKSVKKVSLRKHKKTHETFRELHLCPFSGCLKSFTEKGSLRTHVRVAHEGLSRWKIKCDQPGCERDFYYKKQLERHIQREHNRDLGISSNKLESEEFSRNDLLAIEQQRQCLYEQKDVTMLTISGSCKFESKPNTTLNNNKDHHHRHDTTNNSSNSSTNDDYTEFAKGSMHKIFRTRGAQKQQRRVSRRETFLGILSLNHLNANSAMATSS